MVDVSAVSAGFYRQIRTYSPELPLSCVTPDVEQGGNVWPGVFQICRRTGLFKKWALWINRADRCYSDGLQYCPGAYRMRWVNLPNRESSGQSVASTLTLAAGRSRLPQHQQLFMWEYK
jgi:hypothetical protein